MKNKSLLIGTLDVAMVRNFGVRSIATYYLSLLFEFVGNCLGIIFFLQLVR